MYREQKLPSSCQLVAAVNARIYLGKGDVYENEYEELVDLSGCRNGVATDIAVAEKELGLDVYECLYTKNLSQRK